MGYRIDPTFLSELENYGASDIRACFNCGSCTAICPHSEGTDTFPRRLIRYGQLGLREPIVGSKDLWVCHYCGECSETCPREAEPGEFMAAARRYAIARNDVTGLARVMYLSPILSWIVIVVISVVMGVLLLQGSGPINGRFFEFISSHMVHNVGIGAMVLAILAMVGGMVRMGRSLRSAAKEFPIMGDGANPVTKLSRAVGAVIAEVGIQKRYRECGRETNTKEAWFVSRWFVHGTMVWGFIGLLFATTWDFLDKLPDGSAVALTYPPRLVGTIAAALFLYGSAVALGQRFAKSNKYAERSQFSDWLLIWLMFLLAVSGMVLLFLAYLAPATAIGNIILLAHVVLAFDLIVLLPFSKFAHVVYRTMAIFVHAYKGIAVAPVTSMKQAA